MKVFMFFTKHVSTWQAKLLADLFPSLVGFVFISVYVDPHVPKYRSPIRLSGVGSRGEQLKQGAPDFPFPGHIDQL